MPRGGVRGPMRRILFALLGSLVLSAAFLPGAASARARPGSCLLRAHFPTCYVWFGKVTFISDGHTVSVYFDGDGTHRSQRIRITGIQAMEQTTYPVSPSKRRGECHAVEATARLQQLLQAS